MARGVKPEVYQSRVLFDRKAANARSQQSTVMWRKKLPPNKEGSNGGDGVS
ncbi:conserved hypothetical protein [Ricinus communis]|uniref:Uncharacterized protein n=1 Tax=Ricinus communis TaxID=3988 RepID=B9RAF6_RICCO|nr:conserved hypothetical protein [Ricinus communis]